LAGWGSYPTVRGTPPPPPPDFAGDRTEPHSAQQGSRILTAEWLRCPEFVALRTLAIKKVEELEVKQVMSVKSGDSVYNVRCAITREFTLVSFTGSVCGSGSIRTVLDWLVPDPTFSHLQLYSYVVASQFL